MNSNDTVGMFTRWPRLIRGFLTKPSVKIWLERYRAWDPSSQVSCWTFLFFCEIFTSTSHVTTEVKRTVLKHWIRYLYSIANKADMLTRVSVGNGIAYKHTIYHLPCLLVLQQKLHTCKLLWKNNLHRPLAPIYIDFTCNITVRKAVCKNLFKGSDFIYGVWGNICCSYNMVWEMKVKALPYRNTDVWLGAGITADIQ